MWIPDIDFSCWYKWADRVNMDNIDSPGIYLLAKFYKPPPEKADVLDSHIIYFGESCDNSLKGRWRQFDRTAFQASDEHSGGRTYRDTFNDNGADLYVAAMPVTDLSDNLKPLFIRFAERKLILDFAVEHGAQPILNKK